VLVLKGLSALTLPDDSFMLRGMLRLVLPSLVRASLVALAFAGGSAWADTDQITRLLSDKGLIAPGGAASTPAAAPPAEPTPAATAAPLAASTATAPESFTQHVRQKASDMVLTAMNFLGVPYRRGGNDADSGFDCSGFTRHIFESSLGLVLPRRADEQAHAKGLLAVKRDDLKPGDLVFFNTLRRTFSHVGIYIGEGKFIHAPKPGGEVRVEDMRFSYWAKRFTGARRAEQAEASAVEATPLAEPLSDGGAVATVVNNVATAATTVAAPIAAAVPEVLKPGSPPPTRKASHKTRRKPAAKAVKA
jgi:cell wall-associated NlpC family hydrolase